MEFMELKKKVSGVALTNVHTGVDLHESGEKRERGANSRRRRVTLMAHKLYLDSCASYHTMFSTFWLENVHKVNHILTGHCNRG